MSRVAGALIAVLLALALLPAAAGAHATIVRTAPADTAVLQTQPREVAIKWSEPVDLGKTGLRLLDATGAEVEGTKATRGADPSTATLTLPGGLAQGTYVVAWQVTSADSHPVSGAFSFSIGKPSAVVTASGGDGGPSLFIEIVDAAARGLSFIGLALTLGGAFLLLFIWPEGPASPRARRAFWTGTGLLGGGSLAVLLLQGPYADGSLGFTLSTRFGQALLIRIVLTALFAWLVTRALGRSRSAGRGPAPARPLAGALGVTAVALLLTWTLTDHSRTGVQVWLGIPAATIHLFAMSLWFGGLALLVVAAIRPDVSLVPALPRFSRLALLCFGALVVTGVYMAWRQAGAFGAFPGTDFGKLLLVKIGAVLAIIALGARSRSAVAAGAGTLAQRIRRTVVAEIVLGVIVFGLTATLVNAEPARVAYAPPYDATVDGPSGSQVQVHLEPAKQGENVLDVYLEARGGGLLIPPEVTARLLPDGGDDVGPLPVDLGSAEPGHYVASRMTVPFPGDWTLELAVRTSDIDEDVVKVPLHVR